MFKNRKEAALKLAETLQFYRDKDPLVLAIPKGGVEIGYYIARELETRLAILVVQKLAHPNQPEAAFGAIAEDKSLYLNPESKSILSRELIQQVIEEEEKEIQRRIIRYRKGKPLPDITNRIAILVDDGIATGATIFAAVKLCKKHNARQIIVASPVSSISIYEKLLDTVDVVVIPLTPAPYKAVSQAYLEFRNLNDKEVIQFLDKTQDVSKDEEQSVNE